MGYAICFFVVNPLEDSATVFRCRVKFFFQIAAFHEKWNILSFLKVVFLEPMYYVFLK